MFVSLLLSLYISYYIYVIFTPCKVYCGKDVWSLSLSVMKNKIIIYMFSVIYFTKKNPKGTQTQQTSKEKKIWGCLLLIFETFRVNIRVYNYKDHTWVILWLICINKEITHEDTSVACGIYFLLLPTIWNITSKSSLMPAQMHVPFDVNQTV